MNEMDLFLKKPQTLKLTQDEIAASIREMEFIVKNLPKRHLQAPMVSLENSTQRFQAN